MNVESSENKNSSVDSGKNVDMLSGFSTAGSSDKKLNQDSTVLKSQLSKNDYDDVKSIVSELVTAVDGCHLEEKNSELPGSLGSLKNSEDKSKYEIIFNYRNF